MSQTGSTKEDVVRRGKEIYERALRARLEPGHNGRFVAIDVPQAVRASIGRASSHASTNKEMHLTSGRSHDRPPARR